MKTRLQQVSRILNYAAKLHGTTAQAIASRSQADNVVMARNEACHTMHRWLGLVDSVIAQYVGMRSVSSVLRARRRFRAWILVNNHPVQPSAKG